VTSGLIHDYRLNRIESAKAGTGKPPARQTMHREIVALRQVLKLALRKGYISGLPDLSEPYRSNGKISHRPGFHTTNTRSSTKQREIVRRTLRTRRIHMTMKICTTMWSSW
jgi:hypothetical protein